MCDVDRELAVGKEGLGREGGKEGWMEESLHFASPYHLCLASAIKTVACFCAFSAPLSLCLFRVTNSNQS